VAVSGQHHVPVVLHQGKKKNTTHCRESWVGPRTHMNGFWRRENVLSPTVFEPQTVLPVARSYTTAYYLLLIYPQYVNFTCLWPPFDYKILSNALHGRPLDHVNYLNINFYKQLAHVEPVINASHFLATPGICK
jgi:hypothetical protein